MLGLRENCLPVKVPAVAPVGLGSHFKPLVAKVGY